MSEIEMPVLIKGEGGVPFRIPAKIDAFVSLDDPESKGIHMSRLYGELKSVFDKEPLGLKAIKHILTEFVNSQKGLSENSYVKVELELPLERPALISEKIGWRHYPVFFEGFLKGSELKFNMGVQIAYSSTCPCSAALAKQIIAEKFEKDFSGQEILKKEELLNWLEEDVLAATPHAQRSYGDVTVTLDPDTIAPEPVELINTLEEALKTPVQAAVKREDEQEFARLNGENQMFCEDAARRIKKALNSESRYLDYYIRVDHQESLHPHNAVSYAVKGIDEGFSL